MTSIVVGAGVMGLATAWHLARAGEAVTVLERGPIPDPSAASWDSHRLIRALYRGRPGYTRMALDAYAAWDEVWAAAGVRHYENCGSIAFSRAEGDRADGCRAPLDALGAAYEPLPPAWRCGPTRRSGRSMPRPAPSSWPRARRCRPIQWW